MSAYAYLTYANTRTLFQAHRKLPIPYTELTAGGTSAKKYTVYIFKRQKVELTFVCRKIM